LAKKQGPIKNGFVASNQGTLIPSFAQLRKTGMSLRHHGLVDGTEPTM
jgi:hypothetical protein